MSDWQTTAKTIYCDAVDDEVTILIFKNFSLRCTGCKKYTEQNDTTLNLIREKSSKMKRIVKCEGENCPRVTEYRDKISAEEAK
jgi:TATA-box binding protein (TBP) (component of TFIID and TFIIIB)